MKGVARKSCKHDPGPESAWPPPPWPTAVCYEIKSYRELITISMLTIQTYHKESVTNPNSLPAVWTFWDLQWLTVNSDDVRWNFTDDTARDVAAHFIFWDWHHWNFLWCRQPERAIVSWSIITNVVLTARHYWHRWEFADAWSWCSQILICGVIVSIDIQQGVSVPDLDVSCFTLWNFLWLTVLDQ